MHSMRLVAELALLGSRAELQDLRCVCRLQLLRAATRRAAISTTFARIETASLPDDALLVPPALPWVESQAFGRMRAAAQQLNDLPPAVREGCTGRARSSSTCGRRGGGESGPCRDA